MQILVQSIQKQQFVSISDVVRLVMALLSKVRIPKCPKLRRAGISILRKREQRRTIITKQDGTLLKMLAN